MQHLCLNTTQHQHVPLTHKVNNVQTLKIEDGMRGPFENPLDQEGCMLCSAITCMHAYKMHLQK